MCLWFQCHNFFVFEDETMVLWCGKIMPRSLCNINIGKFIFDARLKIAFSWWRNTAYFGHRKLQTLSIYFMVFLYIKIDKRNCKIIILILKLNAVVWISGSNCTASPRIAFNSKWLHIIVYHEINSFNVFTVFFMRLLQAIYWIFIILSYEQWAMTFSSFFKWEQKEFRNFINDGGNCFFIEFSYSSSHIFWLFLDFLLRRKRQSNRCERLYFERNRRRIYFYSISWLTFIAIFRSDFFFFIE